jgi:hypothetical protein
MLKTIPDTTKESASLLLLERKRIRSHCLNQIKQCFSTISWMLYLLFVNLRQTSAIYLTLCIFRLPRVREARWLQGCISYSGIPSVNAEVTNEEKE